MPALPREAEVQDLHVPVLGDEDVLGLQIAVDDALVVAAAAARGDLQREVQQPCGPGAPESEPARAASRLRSSSMTA